MIREFLSLIITPIPVLFLLIFATLIFFGLNRRKGGKILCCIAGFWFLVITTSPVTERLVKSLENQYPQVTETFLKKLPDSCNIIVLGSGHSDDKNLSPNNQLSLSALGRLIEGIRIQKLIPGSKLILSGFRGRSELSQALVLYRTALLLGVDSSSMSIMPLPANTRMEATEYVKNFGIRQNLILVTSAVHIPRAMILFRKTGLNPIPEPTNYLFKQGSRKDPWRWLPSSQYIAMMEAVMHEYAGLVWDWLGGN